MVYLRANRSDWTLDLTHPRVDVQDGWQYSRVLDDPEDKWLADIPPPLERLLTGSGVVSATVSGSSSNGGGANGLMSPRGKGKGPLSTNLSYARRRRWVSVCESLACCPLCAVAARSPPFDSVVVEHAYS